MPFCFFNVSSIPGAIIHSDDAILTVKKEDSKFVVTLDKGSDGSEEIEIERLTSEPSYAAQDVMEYITSRLESPILMADPGLRFKKLENAADLLRCVRAGGSLVDDTLKALHKTAIEIEAHGVDDNAAGGELGRLYRRLFLPLKKAHQAYMDALEALTYADGPVQGAPF